MPSIVAPDGGRPCHQRLMLYNAGVPASIHIRLDSSLAGQTGWNCAPAQPRLLLRCDGRTRLATLHDSGELLRKWKDPLDALAWLDQNVRHRDSAANSRWIGYLSYDLGRLFEALPSPPDDDLGLPLFVFGFVEGNTPPSAEAGIDPIRSIEGASPAFGSKGGTPASGENKRHAPASGEAGMSPFRSTFTPAGYLNAVRRAMEYIRAGDVFQVNLSQRFTIPQHDEPAAIYQRLLTTAPGRYGALLEFDDHALICNSPELFLNVTPDPLTGERRILTRPIKGTRPLGPGMEHELRDSAKDQAELNMIVDLERNDLGRVCRIGSVKVPEPRTIEAHPMIYHGAAAVMGVLRDGVGFVDLLRATFPGGSITGAPKIRALQIIDELEPVRRGPYCGAIGYLAADGRVELNIAIRTMIVRWGQVHIPVGGGIVADSNPLDEYEETLVKAQAMFSALNPQ